MPKQTVVKRGSSRKVGNRKDHCQRYEQRGALMKNKIKRIMQSNGKSAANSYRHDKTKEFPPEGAKD